MHDFSVHSARPRGFRTIFAAGLGLCYQLCSRPDEEVGPHKRLNFNCLHSPCSIDLLYWRWIGWNFLSNAGERINQSESSL